MAPREQTFIMVKPDGVQRGLISKIMKRFEQRGYRLVALKIKKASVELLEKHYSDLKKKPFFPNLVSHMSSGPVVCMVWEGNDVVNQGRKMMGETVPSDSKPGSIRGDYCIDVGRNIVHGSDSIESAKKEIKLWFEQEELVEWVPCLDHSIHE